MGTAVSTKRTLRDELIRFEGSYKALLPKGYAPERLITGALVAVQLNPDLNKCTPVSIATALARVAQWGLDVGETAHLVPFGQTCTPVADYKGLIRLMLRAGARKVEAHEVREGDVFRYEYGTHPTLQHQPNGDTSKPITHAYAIAWLRSGEVVFEVMTAGEIDAIRKDKSKNWKNGTLPKWYSRKCVIRQLAKYMDRSPELARVIETDETPLDPEPEPEPINRLAAVHARRLEAGDDAPSAEVVDEDGVVHGDAA